MGLRNSSEYLEEMLSRVLGDLLAQGVLVKIHDDLVIGGRTVDELQSNWIKVLQHLQQNNIFLSAEKTVICPMTVTILGWIWSQGTLKVDLHKLNPLQVCPPPSSVKQMRSFIGA